MEILYLIIFFILGSFVGTISTILGLRIPKKEKTGEKTSNTAKKQRFLGKDGFDSL